MGKPHYVHVSEIEDLLERIKEFDELKNFNGESVLVIVVNFIHAMQEKKARRAQQQQQWDRV